MTEATNAAPDPVIECVGLTKTFGALRAVDDLNLTVFHGELFGFLGPNGAGKTTTIRMITGLLRPTSGFARIGGYDIAREPLQAKRLFGYIPDTAFLYEKLTGREFIRFMADLYSVPLKGQAGEARVEQLLERFELTEKGDELIQGYSRGMRQRIALCGALIHEPRVIILDEPTVGLDPRSARQMKDTLRRHCNEGGTVFVSTHILEVAERMCDRFAILHRGRIAAAGSMDELRGLSSGAERLEDIFLELTGGADD